MTSKRNRRKKHEPPDRKSWKDRMIAGLTEGFFAGTVEVVFLVLAKIFVKG